MPSARKADLIEGFITGLSTITAFSAVTPRMTASELAMRLDISRAAARRYLITLHHAGYADTDGRIYWLTPKVLGLGRSYMGSALLPRTARPFLQQLTAEVQESSNLAVIDGTEVVYTASANVARLMSTTLEPGTRLPAHTTAAGRVILGALSPAALEAWLANAELTAHTPHTVIDKGTFSTEVAAARKAGYSIVDSQFEVGLRGIAVPIAGPHGMVVGAIGISMASATCSVKEARRRCVPPLLRTAAALQDLIQDL